MHVLMATRDPTLRLSLELLLTEEPSVTVLGSASEADGLLSLIRSTCPDIVILDWELPGKPVSELIASIPKTRFIVLGTRSSSMKQALDAGASAFVRIGDPPEAFLATYRQVRADIVWAAGQADK